MYHFLILLLGCVLCSCKDITASIRLVEDATVTLELTNTASYGVALLRWNLPLDDRFESDTFRVLYQGNEVEYIGARVKYDGPFVNDYVFFFPNETKEYTIRLENSYDFSQPGDYDVVFVADVLDHETDGAFHSLPHIQGSFVPLSGVISNSLMFSTPKGLVQKIVRAEYTCSSSENTQINNAYTAEKQMIGYAQTKINAGQSTDFTTWMGAWDTTRYNHVRDVIGRVRTNTIFAPRCDDTAGVYAFVYPTDTQHRVYFCAAFWKAPNAGGYDTKAGTIIHELSHFNRIGSTQDYVYGTTGARNLASSNPARATHNADNFEYFCESQW